jgi:hypothetical protein
MLSEKNKVACFQKFLDEKQEYKILHDYAET